MCYNSILLREERMIMKDQRKEQLEELMLAFVANGGVVTVVKPNKAPKNALYFSRNIPGSIAHKGATKARIVGY